ncbi:MAG: twin-arginine translocation signal domain-containing protein, partial [Armatimonadota bacterium]|nr:twin-arginine translocation signal domain-containing protein [Armatimonadota bacterium]
MQHKRNLSRRQFLKSTGAAVITASALGWNYAWAAGSDRIRVGLVGCGGRGTGAARDAVNAAEGVEIWALGDLFRDRLDSCRRALAGLGDKMQVSDDRC